MKTVDFDLNYSVNDIINQLVEEYKNKDNIVGIYKICYEDAGLYIIELNLIFENTEYLPINCEKYLELSINDTKIQIAINGRHSKFYKIDSYPSSSDFVYTEIFKDMLYNEILYEENNILTNFKNYTLKMQKCNIFPFGTMEMEYNNIIDFKSYMLERKKV